MTRWPWLLLMTGAAIAIALGLSSLLFPFFHAHFTSIAAVLAAFVYGTWRSWSNIPKIAPDRSSSLTALAAGALFIALILGAVAMSKVSDLNPQGQWDAWSIWNLRAKFLASDFPSRAWSPLLTNTHPEYPLLVSGAVEAAGGAAAAVSFLFFASLIAMVTGGLAFARGPIAGLVAGLTLATSGALLHEVPSQYADVPLATYLAGSLIFILVDRPIWAGVLAGFAMWTKDEGALFCVAVLALIAIFRRRDFVRVFLGMLPGVLLYVGFKTFLAPRVSALSGPGALARFADPHRWSVVLTGVASSIFTLGAGWFHPIFVIAALAIGVRFVARDSPRDAFFSTALAAIILAGYCVAMVTASADAVWQTNTAAGRLVVQWWPLAVIAMMMWLRPAEEFIVEESPVKKKRR